MIVNCPHCGMQMEDDGQLAGQLVMCPRCRGQMLMPQLSYPHAAQTPPAPPLVSGPPEQPFVTATSTAYRRSPKRSNTGLNLAIAGGSLMVLILALTLARGCDVATDLMKPTTYSHYYSRGYQAGRDDHNSGRQFDGEAWKYFEEGPWATIQFSILPPPSAAELKDWKREHPVPPRGSSSYGAARRGYEEGYAKGFYNP